MTADALSPRIARASAAMVLSMEDKQILVFHEKWFQLPVPSPFCEKLENANIFNIFWNKFSIKIVQHILFVTLIRTNYEFSKSTGTILTMSDYS